VVKVRSEGLLKVLTAVIIITAWAIAFIPFGSFESFYRFVTLNWAP
jgi:hypothetical protein